MPDYLEAGLELQRIAVTVRRECHRANVEFARAIAGRFPTREDREKEVALRAALAMADRAVLDAAEVLNA